MTVFFTLLNLECHQDTSDCNVKFLNNFTEVQSMKTSQVRRMIQRWPRG